uniref:Cationic amino acid transporter C-terminal domain-containing protein n=1 Tax=Glossina austeni TaxID=7395 RepID=A0A1A9UQJ4_GLOAU
MVLHTSYWKVLTRRKQVNNEGTDGDSKLNRVLGLYDLTALGVGSTLGAGVYILAGQIAKDQAGPSVMISFAIAALASLLAGACYAEFGARVPKAGSAYIYSYVCIGEFAAFVIGWNLILEYIIGTASVCRAISLYLDTLINDTLKITFAEVAPINVSFLGSYFDFFACSLVIVFGVALAFGVETSTMANNFFTCLNLFILLFVIIAGSVKANFSNWNISVNNVNKSDLPHDINLGNGGYFPFGFEGTLKGAATCFFGFVGFDCIATTGEEVRNPTKNIPRSFILSLLIIFSCYFGVSTVLTLMIPYYQQDANAPLPCAFKEVGWNFAMWLVTIGGLIGLIASLFGALFPLPRIIYSMAQDGLLFRSLGKIHPKYKVPVIGSIIAAFLTALIAGLFDLAQLVNLLSIGTLLAYSMVAISITILRYMDNSNSTGRVQNNGYQQIPEDRRWRDNSNGSISRNNLSNGFNGLSGYSHSESSLLTGKGERITFICIVKQLFNCRRLEIPTKLSTRIVGVLTTLFCLLSMGIGLIFMQAYDALLNRELWILISLSILLSLITLVLIFIYLQPCEIPNRALFRVPFVPIVPAISIFINIYLMLQLDTMTWIRFGIWMAIGLPMFVACWCMNDIKNPAKRHPDRMQLEELIKKSTQVQAKYVEKPISSEDCNIYCNSGWQQENGKSIKNLDEIINIRDVAAELKEMKNSNGKLFYVSEEPTNDEPTKFVSLPAYIDTTAEENSVMAFLDDVLQLEEDGGGETTTHLNRKEAFSQRNESIDSSMIPTVTKSTTVATVHSSSDTSEYDSGEIYERHSERSFSSNDTSTNEDSLNERRLQAAQLVEDILKSSRLSEILQNRKINDRKKEDHTITSPNPRESIKSVTSPLHSADFKNRLSRLIIKPLETKFIKDSKEYDIEKRDKGSLPKLQHSKSEADIENSLMKAIENRNDPVRINSQNYVQVPKAPKFDPALYNTMTSLRSIKDRADLAVILKTTELDGHKDKQKITKDSGGNAEVPFKVKLEALLKRGPSHRAQRILPPEPKRPNSISAIKIGDSDDETLSVTTAFKSEDNLSYNSKSVETLLEARKALKPIKNKPYHL